MTGELIPTGVTYGVGRKSINDAFSGTAYMNNIELDSGGNFNGGVGGGIIYSAGTDLYNIFSNSNSNLWSSSTGSNSIIANNGTGNIASGEESFVIGRNNLLSGKRSVILGGQNITGSTDDTVYTPSLVVRDNLGIGVENTNYRLHISNGDSQLVYDGSSLSNISYLILSGDTNDLSSMAVIEANGGESSIGIGVRGSAETIYNAYGAKSDAFVYCGNATNGLNIINSFGGSYSNRENYIRFYAGITANSPSHLHIQGSGSTKGNLGISTENPQERLHVNGNVKIENDLFLPTPKVPVTSGDTGVTGQISWDSNYIYVCISSNTWKRVALSGW